MIADTFIREPANVYHATTGYMSSHRLAEFRQCPKLFRERELGNLPPERSWSFAFGQAAHLAILEGLDVYHDEVVAGGPINPRTGKPYGRDTAAYAQWAAQQTGITITADEYADIREMRTAVHSHELAAEILRTGLAERVIRRELFGVPFQCRIDWITKLDGIHAIADLKTCEDLDWFESDAKRFGYVYQVALYRQMLADHLNILPGDVSVYIIAVEKGELHRAGVWKVETDTLNRAGLANKLAIEEYLDCKTNNRWPTRYEGQRVLYL